MKTGKEEVYEASLSEEMLNFDRNNLILRMNMKQSEGKSRLEPPSIYDPDKVEKMMQGAIDVHIHPGPDPYYPRLADALEIAIDACDAGMQAVAYKSHQFPSAPYASIVQNAVNKWAEEHGKTKMDVFGGVVLNNAVGGLNPAAVIAMARIGGKVVWTPNQDARHRKKRMDKPGGIEVLDEKDRVVPEMMEILSLVAEGDLILGLTGGQSTKERFILIDAAREMGIEKIEVIHPNQPNCKMTVPQMKIAADKGAYIGLYCYDFCPPLFSWDEFLEAVKLIGPERILAGTDMGGFVGLPPIVAMRRFITGMFFRGLEESAVEKIVKTNARNLFY